MPRAAAARATATSPSGCTACTPVGRDEHRQRDRLRPSPWSPGRARPSSPATCGAKPSSRERGDVVVERQAALGAGEERAVDRRRQPLLAPAAAPRRPISNQPLPSDAGRLVAADAASSSHARSRGGRREWSADGCGASRSPRSERASPWPCTHSGSGPSSGRPVKNFAAMQPPRQASYDAAATRTRRRLRLAQRRGTAPTRATRAAKPPASRTLPARNSSWIANGQA